MNFINLVKCELQLFYQNCLIFKDVLYNQSGIWSEQLLRLGGLNHVFGISTRKVDAIRFRLLNL
jgi:hypothetical protein